jgi:hypothetical protein
MSVTATVHAYGASRERFLAEIAKKLDADGFDLCETEPLDEPVLRRIVIRGSGRWCSFAEVDVDETDTWGSYLARSLGAPVLGLLTWEDEAAAVWTLYEKGKMPQRVEPLRQATRDKNGRVRVAPGFFSRWIPAGRQAAPAGSSSARTAEKRTRSSCPWRIRSLRSLGPSHCRALGSTPTRPTRTAGTSS